ncbi:hypothetical protein ES703_94911 [subsurface metagenome]
MIDEGGIPHMPFFYSSSPVRKGTFCFYSLDYTLFTSTSKGWHSYIAYVYPPSFVTVRANYPDTLNSFPRIVKKFCISRIWHKPNPPFNEL